jgi:hypothetical protein
MLLQINYTMIWQGQEEEGKGNEKREEREEKRQKERKKDRGRQEK